MLFLFYSKFKISIEMANLHPILNLLAFAEMIFFNVFFWEIKRKNGIRDSGEKSAGFGIVVKN